MSRSRVLAALAGGTMLLALGMAAIAVPKGENGAPKPPKPAPQKIAVLDVNALFKQHARLKAMMEELQKKAQRAQEHARKEKEEINALRDRLDDAKPGTEQFRKLPKEIQQRTALLNADIELQRKDLLQQQAAICYKVYQQILDEVRRYAKANRVTAVLKYDAEVASPDVPESVVRRLNNPVVYCQEGLDITPIILERINRKNSQ